MTSTNRHLLCVNFFLWNRGELTIAFLKFEKRDFHGLPDVVSEWDGESGGLGEGLARLAGT